METFFIFCYNIQGYKYNFFCQTDKGQQKALFFTGGKIMKYKTKGVCSQAIYFDVDEDHKVHNVQFEGGCNGNTKGIAALVEGMDASEVISRLEGIQCGFKNTSCPDQLSQALKQALNQ